MLGSPLYEEEDACMFENRGLSMLGSPLYEEEDACMLENRGLSMLGSPLYEEEDACMLENRGLSMLGSPLDSRTDRLFGIPHPVARLLLPGKHIPQEENLVVLRRARQP